MRHDGSNALKYQDKRDRFGTFPLNPKECDKATLLDEDLRNADALRVADPNDARLHGWMNLRPNDHYGGLQCNYTGKIVSGEIIKWEVMRTRC